MSAENRRVDIALASGIVYIGGGESFDPAAYISGVTAADGTVLDASAVTVESAVDTNTPGVMKYITRPLTPGGIQERHG